MLAAYTPIEIVIADDHPLFLHSLSALFKDTSEFRLLGQASNGHELVEVSRKYKPDIIITDIKMPVMDGIEATLLLTKELPGCGVIALSIVDEENLIVDMLQAGAKGYLLKDTVIDELLQAVRTVYKGQTYFSDSVKISITDMVAKGEYASHKALLHQYSEKELNIIKLICEEYSTKEIADRLKITKRAVDGLREVILKKMKVKNSAGVVRYAIKHKLYNP
jgi:DNA-binding NarL/FixJ family response regulator